MLHRTALCLPGVVEEHAESFRLGILGFDERADDYVSRAHLARSQSGLELEIVVFVSPGSSEWNAAQIAASKYEGTTICTSSVTAILPAGEAKKSATQFIIETALGSYPINDLFLTRSGGAVNCP